MNLTQEQRDELNKLLKYRDSILSSLNSIELIIKSYFPKEYSIAYQHWIPQIATALNIDDKWLPRGQFCMQNTIDRIIDNDACSGVNK